MPDLVGNPKDRFSHDAAHFVLQDAIQGLESLKSSTWFVILLEIFAYILLIGRLLHDSVTQKVLTQQMIGFLTNASDIFELFSLFDEEKVMEDSNATIYVLIFWTFSFLQFIPIWGSHNLGKTETEHRKQKSDNKKHYMYFGNCICIEFDDGLGKTETKDPDRKVKDMKSYCRGFLDCFDCRRCGKVNNDDDGGGDDGDDDDEDSTEKYETGFAWVFQDGPFLILRVYLIFKFNLFTQSLIFYSLKNVSLTILLIVKYKCKTLVFVIGIFIAEIIIWCVFTFIVFLTGNYRDFFSE